ncbi:MAG: glycosyltransferase family 4 protein [Planctomycetes bacterium]|nr:glycosyltransferase family 4 protein [Planctomycetota bacterium]
MRVMRVLTRPNLGGPTRQAVALWHAHEALGVATLLVTGQVDRSEAELSPAAAGVPAVGLDEALAAGVQARGFVPLPALRRGFSPFGDRAASRDLARLLRTFRPDVVHTHTSKAGWLGRRAAFRAGAPLVAHTFHGHVLQDYFGRLSSWALARIEAALAARTDLLFAVSPSCAAELAAAGVAPAERFTVVPPAVAVERGLGRAAAREALGFLPQERRCVCIGRLVPIKRVQDFVAMVAAGPEWRGDVYGDGPERGRLEALAAAASGRVRLCGARADVGRWLAAYDVLVLPSVREGCPLVAVEAFAADLPVVGYDVPGVRDVLVAGGGELVPPGAGPAGLLAAARRLLAEPELAAAHADAGRAALGRFAPAAVARQLLDAYRDARG